MATAKGWQAIPKREWRHPRPFLSYLRLGAGQVALFAPDAEPRPLLLVAQLDDGYPFPVGGYGGWEDIARPGQRSATVYTGGPVERLPLKLVLGGWPIDPQLGGLTCDRQVEVLDMLGRPSGTDRGDRPPLIRVKGAVPHDNALWFVDSIEWGDNAVANKRVRRARATVTLGRYVPVELVRIAARRPKGRRYTVRRGERAADIAREQCGARGMREVRAAIKAFRWARTGELIRDPGRIRAGNVLLLPPRRRRR